MRQSGLELAGGGGSALQPAEFVAYVYPLARDVEESTGIPAAALLAQIAWETSWLTMPGAAATREQLARSLHQYASHILSQPQYRQVRAAAQRGDITLYLAELMAAGYTDDPRYLWEVECLLRRHILPQVDLIRLRG